MKKLSFTGRILIIGCGGVARCTLPLLLKHLDMPLDRITVLDAVDTRDAISDEMRQGVQFVQEEIVKDRFGDQLRKYIGQGDLVIDLAWNIDTVDMLDWCHRHGVMYLNTSVELWDPYASRSRSAPTQRTLYVRHMAIRRMMKSWEGQPGPTAVLEHGANPGLVSHFTKMGLLDIAHKILRELPDDPRVPALEVALTARAYNKLAWLTGTKVIHISERDTQVTLGPKCPEHFLNTWSVEGLFEEATAPAELGWGTHESWLPPNACQHNRGPRNQICLDNFGMNTLVRSRVPSSEIVGMVIRHGEAFTISEALTVTDKGRLVYRPTVHYAYLPSPAAVESLNELRANNYQLHDKWKILDDEIEAGCDELGCLLMGHDFKSWWTGTVLSIEEARQLVPGQNATTLQVAASVMSAACWMIRNPQLGVKVPDQLPHAEIIEVAKPYLGKVISQPLDWMPGDATAVDQFDGSHMDDDHWEFRQFLVTPAV